MKRLFIAASILTFAAAPVYARSFVAGASGAAGNVSINGLGQGGYSAAGVHQQGIGASKAVTGPSNGGAKLTTTSQDENGAHGFAAGNSSFGAAGTSFGFSGGFTRNAF